MYIEDLLTLLGGATRKFIINSIDLSMIISLQNQLHNNVSFTEKQGKLVLYLLKKYRNQISKDINQDINQFLSNPIFKNPFRSIQQNRTIKIVSHDVHKKVAKVEFPYDEQLIIKFRQEKSKLDYAIWNNDEKCWMFSLDEKSIIFLGSLIQENNFVADEELKNYLQQVEKITENCEIFVPMIVEDNNRTYQFINVAENVPKNTSNDFLESLFAARKVGIFTWDDKIEKKLSFENFITSSFLKNLPNKHFSFDLEKYSLDLLAPIVKNLLPCLVVVPGGSELVRLQQNFKFFQSLGTKNEEISVLFRLPNDTGKEFNDFVRENKLNSSVSEQTKVVFISSQIPKTILEPRKNFNCVLNYNFYNIHYKVRDFLHWHHNVINVIENDSQRRFNFGNL